MTSGLRSGRDRAGEGRSGSCVGCLAIVLACLIMDAAALYGAIWLAGAVLGAIGA